jgi:hypothetical protein
MVMENVSDDLNFNFSRFSYFIFFHIRAEPQLFELYINLELLVHSDKLIKEKILFFFFFLFSAFY